MQLFEGGGGGVPATRSLGQSQYCVVNKDNFASKKDVFKVLMVSSRRLGDMTPSPRRKHPKKKMIGKLNNLEKFEKN